MFKRVALALLISGVLLSGCGNQNNRVDEAIQSQINKETDVEPVDISSASDNSAVDNPDTVSDNVPQTGQPDIAVSDNNVQVEPKGPVKNPEDSNIVDIDLDLTTMSSTMVYSEVYNIMCSPDEYRNKCIKMNGICSIYEDVVTGQLYYACIIQDATKCCSQGIEFILQDSYAFPNDYPENGAEVTVVGIFETYAEDGVLYCRLKDAVLCQ